MSDNKKIVNTMPPDKPRREISNPTTILFITFGAVILVIIIGTTVFADKVQYYEEQYSAPPQPQLPLPQGVDYSGYPGQRVPQQLPPPQAQPQLPTVASPITVPATSSTVPMPPTSPPPSLPAVAAATSR